MAALLSLHWAPTPTEPIASCASAWACDPLFAQHAAQSFVAFLLIAAASWATIGASKAFGSQSFKTRVNLMAYSLSVIHHSCVVPVCIWAILKHAETGVPPYAVISVALAFFTGYICADTLVYIVPLRDIVFGVHHTLALVLIGGLLGSSPVLLRWVPSFLVCEASSFGLVVSYVLKKLGRSASLLSAIANAYFVVAFFCLRIVYLGAATLAMLTGPALAPDRAALGPVGQCGVAALWLLQVYWLKAILQALVEMIRGAPPAAVAPAASAVTPEGVTGSVSDSETKKSQ